MLITTLLLTGLVLTTTYFSTETVADVYLHNPMGGNNRCDERDNNRINANRLFDSQNNAAGGYSVHCSRPDSNEVPINCYSSEYYTDTIIPVTWSSQHNCGDNNNCNFVIQYACDDILGSGVRNGMPQSNMGNTCTTTIPYMNDTLLDNPTQYGRHENYEYYGRCSNRTRNMGLFTADQSLQGTSSQFTRQNPTGARYGFECPEERDYYPYWAESNWEDIAILTTDTSRCEYYLNNSRCNTDKMECQGVSQFSPTLEECETNGGIWVTHTKLEGCNMTCASAPNAPINRLGYMNTFYWKLPATPKQNCILRIRYNISTTDTPWDLTSENNGAISTNPVIKTPTGDTVRLSINTAQYGRVFEDRSYTFNIIDRPVEIANATILNVNVQGKRGNIAQISNAIEYEFIPAELEVREEEYLHFQFIGSDFNAVINDGQGRSGTDRSNVVQMVDFKSGLVVTDETNLTANGIELLFNENIRSALALLGQDTSNNSTCFTMEEIEGGASENQEDMRNCPLLNVAEPYFNLPPFLVDAAVSENGTKTYYFMSTRNNHFSNRAQKLKITVLGTGYTPPTSPPTTTPAPIYITQPPPEPVNAVEVAAPIAALLGIVLILVFVMFIRSKYNSKQINFTNQFRERI